ncbi:hypothetical protein HK103_000606 [Boothiomyces macroporosus]|uniref:Uncharacterized protein n=1 Tax=Boothiomyces macroporosus TaxID=261099 RepID=A0AAD5UKE1_9FUNG|nr:hypothetical protein HK103_000606 [Boothiomyces macroporosus]
MSATPRDLEKLGKLTALIKSHSLLDSNPPLQALESLRTLLYEENTETILQDVNTIKDLADCIYYFVAETKSQTHDSLRKETTFGQCVSNIVTGSFLDEHESPQFVLDMLEGTKGDGERNAFALVGLIRALQNRKEKHLKTSRRRLHTAEIDLIQTLTKLEQKDFSVLLFGEVMAKSNLEFADMQTKIDVEAFANNCIDSITQSENFLKLNQNVFKELENSGVQNMFNFFDNKTKPDSIFFSTLGRASKAISLAIAELLERGKYRQVQGIFEKLRMFNRDLSISWQECSFSAVEPNKENEALIKKIWKYFQIVLFSYLVIIDPFSNIVKRRFLKKEDVAPSVILPIVNSILITLQSLNFIISRFGSGGLPQFDSIYAVLIATILKISTLPEFKAQNRQTLELLFENIYSSDSTTNPTLLARQSFYLQTSGKFIDFVGDDYIGKVLDFARPRLIPLNSPRNTATPSENELAVLDLTESAHSVFLDLFATSTLHQKIVREVTIPYVEQLLTDSFRRVIRGLCDFSGIYDHPIQKKRSLLVFEDESFKFNIIEEPDYEFKAHVDDLAHELWAKEATDLSWKAILLLVDFIADPSKIIEQKKETNSSNNNAADLLNFNKEVVSSSNQIRLLRILFEQISTVSLAKLPELLSLVRKLMLYGPNSKDEFDGFGISIDPANSVVWNYLFDSISDHSRVDYTRRYDVVIWYLALYKEAMSIKPKLKKSNGVTGGIKARL